MNFALQYPIFGSEIQCPHCRQTIPALTLTDTYLCNRHGAFEADPNTGELVHLQSSRHWCRWEGEWYRQHSHPDGIRFEIHDALDKLYSQGYRATKVIIAERYRELMGGYLAVTESVLSKPPLDSPKERLRQRPDDLALSSDEEVEPSILPRLFGLPVEFRAPSPAQPYWQIINFSLEQEPGIPIQYPYFRMSS